MRTIWWWALSTGRKRNGSWKDSENGWRNSAGITCGKDAADRVWAVRRSRPKATWRRKTAHLHVLGFHALLWDVSQEWSLHRLAQNGQEANGREARSD